MKSVARKASKARVAKASVKAPVTKTVARKAPASAAPPTVWENVAEGIASLARGKLVKTVLNHVAPGSDVLVTASSILKLGREMYDSKYVPKPAPYDPKRKQVRKQMKCKK